MVPFRFSNRGALPALAMIAATMTGCGAKPQLTVGDAWVRLAAVKGRPAAAYFTVHGGPKPATLIAVTSDVAVRAEMHRSMSANGMASMAPLARVEVPANTDVSFAPGGRHVMLFDINPGIKPGSTMTLTFTFANGDRIPLVTNVVGAGDPKPQS